MNPIIVEEKEIILVGVAQLGQSDIGKLWDMFVEMEDRLSNADPEAGYELHIYPEDDDKNTQIMVMAGFEVNQLPDQLPLFMVIKPLPKTTYVVFDYHFKDGDYVWINQKMKDWLKNSSFEQHLNYSIQRYDKRFTGMEDENSMIQFYIPIRLK